MLATTGWAGARHFDTPTLIGFGALYAPLVREGQTWRALTAMFIHVTPLHLLMNMLALWRVGAVLEPHYGRGRFVALYVLGGLGGSALSLAWHWSRPVASAGASGAICALIFAGIVAGQSWGGVEGRRFRNAMLPWAVLVLVTGASVSADNAAHAGGLIAGAALGWLLARRGRERQPAPAIEGMGLEAIFLVVVVAAGFVFAYQQRDQSFSAPEWVARGLERQGAEAIAAFRRAIVLEPDRAVAHYDLALALERDKQLAGAEDEARRATGLEPAQREAWALLARILVRENKDAEAKLAFDRYVDLGGRLDEKP